MAGVNRGDDRGGPHAARGKAAGAQGSRPRPGKSAAEPWRGIEFEQALLHLKLLCGAAPAPRAHPSPEVALGYLFCISDQAFVGRVLIGQVELDEDVRLRRWRQGNQGNWKKKH